MDLRELKKLNIKRHPWESTRIKALRKILQKFLKTKLNIAILDIGCGDGYAVKELFKGMNRENITGVDIKLTKQQIAELSIIGESDITYLNEYSDIGENRYDIILLLDVLEHIKDDSAFLLYIIGKYLVAGGYVLITVPAFQAIYCAHDTFLEHYRRYNRKEVNKLIVAAGLTCVSSGYLFSSLLLPRFLVLLSQKLFAIKTYSSEGVGNWNHGKIVTKSVEVLLNIDNNISLALNKVGIKIPGLTIWSLCKKQ